jgi:hypothetical protein
MNLVKMLTEKILFKESAYVTKYEGDKNIIDKHVEHILLFDKGRVSSNQGGYQSHDITFGFQELIQFAQMCLTKLEYSFTFGNFWLNVNKGNHYNDEHIHGLTGMSAVYYHKTCCDKTPIYFKHLVPAIVETTVEFSPNDGDIIFFPSHITHGVKACGNVDHERISIAMNFPGKFKE